VLNVLILKHADKKERGSIPPTAPLYFYLPSQLFPFSLEDNSGKTMK
jgi:hypothetical protein